MKKLFQRIALLPYMVNTLLLNMVMLPSALWRSMGADIPQLRAILTVRLIMDDRKPMTMMMRPQKQKKERKYGTLVNTIMYLVFGIVYMFPIIMVEDRILSLTIFFSLLFTVMTLMLITDFSNVLFDSRDKYILFPRPVNDATLVLARMLHVFIYLIRIVIPMSLPGWITLGYLDGWRSALLFPLPLILMVILALFAVNAVYLIVLRLAKPERFKDVISYFQIVASIVFFASVYLLPRFFDSEHTHDFNILHYPWVRYSPSYWLALCWSWIGYPVHLTGTAMYSVLAVICPLGCMFILVKWLSPQFSRRIAGIDAVDAGEYKPAKAARKSSSRLYQKLAYMFNRSDDARAGFMVAWLQTSRSRSFRMRVLPSFAFVPIYFFYMLTQNHKSLSEAYANLSHHDTFLLLLYYSSFMMLSAMNYINISDQYKAAWVYYSSPLVTPGKVMVGALKAVWLKFFLPFICVLSAFVLYVWGADKIWDVLLATVNVTLFISFVARISNRHLPFSIAEQIKQSGGRILKTFAAILIPAVLGVGHYFSLHLLWLKMIYLVLSSIMLWLVVDSYGNTSWDNVVKAAEEG